MYSAALQVLGDKIRELAQHFQNACSRGQFQCTEARHIQVSYVENPARIYHSQDCQVLQAHSSYIWSAFNALQATPILSESASRRIDRILTPLREDVAQCCMTKCRVLPGGTLEHTPECDNLSQDLSVIQQLVLNVASKESAQDLKAYHGVGKDAPATPRDWTQFGPLLKAYQDLEFQETTCFETYGCSYRGMEANHTPRCIRANQHMIRLAEALTEYTQTVGQTVTPSETAADLKASIQSLQTQREAFKLAATTAAARVITLEEENQKLRQTLKDSYKSIPGDRFALIELD